MNAMTNAIADEADHSRSILMSGRCDPHHDRQTHQLEGLAITRLWRFESTFRTNNLRRFLVAVSI
jgi:hypothetical protein